MEKRFLKKVIVTALTSVLFVAPAWLLLADVEDQYSDWSAPVNLGSIVNFTSIDFNPAISKDGLSLYFASNRLGGFGSQDIWVSQRPCTDADDPACAWQTPVNLGPKINSSANENTPSLSPDGHRLYFASNRPDTGFGGLDLYVSRRHNKRDDLGWQPSENLGSGVNTFFDEIGPAVFEDEVTGVIALYFISNRPEGIGDFDIYASTLQADETFGAVELVEELSSPFNDSAPDIRRDGLEIFLGSNRPGSLGAGVQGLDLWVATRASTSDPWSTPVTLGPVVNSGLIENAPALSFNGTELYFHSTRPGGVGPCSAFGAPPCVFDLWVTTRTKLKQPD